MREAPPGTGSPEAPRAREKAIYAGGHGEVAIPVPIPNTEVKHLCADDTAESGKVGSCRLFYFKPRLCPGGQAGYEDPGGVLAWSLRSDTVSCHPASCALYGVSASSLVGAA